MFLNLIINILPVVELCLEGKVQILGRLIRFFTSGILQRYRMPI